jgi:zinc protease
MNRTRLASFFRVAVLAAPALLSGQGAPPDDKAIPASKIERKRKAPVNEEVLRVKLPRAVEFKLDNGLTVLLIEDHRLPTVTARLLIQGAGSIFDPPDTPGLANLTAAMLKEGTASRDSKQIAEDVDRLGATLMASAPFGADSATINASGLSDNLPEWLTLTSDILLHPSFPQAELAKLKQRQKVQLQQQRSSPFFLIRERFNLAIYGNHPAAITSATPESIDAITADKLKKWRDQRYVPQNAILGVAGDVTLPALKKILSSLPEWAPTDLKLPSVPAAKASTEKHIFVVDRPGSVQTDVYLGDLAIDRVDPDYMALTVMNRVVGGGPAARLFSNLREEHGYTYGAYSHLTAGKWAGPWFAFANMRTSATDGAMTEFMNEFRRIRDEKVPEAELEEAKRSLVAGFALSLESPEELLQAAITQKIYGLPADYWDTYPAKISQITAEQVQRVARKYVNLDALQIVAVGDAAKIKPVLEKLGPVDVFDTQGKKRPAGTE